MQCKGGASARKATSANFINALCWRNTCNRCVWVVSTHLTTRFPQTAEHAQPVCSSYTNFVSTGCHQRPERMITPWYRPSREKLKKNVIRRVLEYFRSLRRMKLPRMTPQPRHPCKESRGLNLSNFLPKLSSAIKHSCGTKVLPVRMKNRLCRRKFSGSWTSDQATSALSRSKLFPSSTRWPPGQIEAPEEFGHSPEKRRTRKGLQGQRVPTAGGCNLQVSQRWHQGTEVLYVITTGTDIARAYREFSGWLDESSVSEGAVMTYFTGPRTLVDRSSLPASTRQTFSKTFNGVRGIHRAPTSSRHSRKDKTTRSVIQETKNGERHIPSLKFIHLRLARQFGTIDRWDWFVCLYQSLPKGSKFWSCWRGESINQSFRKNYS